MVSMAIELQRFWRYRLNKKALSLAIGACITLVPTKFIQYQS